MANAGRRDRFNEKMGKHFSQVDNELETLFNAHNKHDSGAEGWANVNIKDGSNKRMGIATLVGGTIAVSNTSVTANTRIFTSRQTSGGTVGHLSVTRSAGVSFTITSSSATDTSVVAWLLIEPK